MEPRKQELVLISSINSTNLRKLVFALPDIYRTRNSLWDSRGWISFDNMICGLVDRLRMSGYRHTLELELQIAYLKLGKQRHERFLPKFKEKGLVRIVEVLSGRVREWP